MEALGTAGAEGFGFRMRADAATGIGDPHLGRVIDSDIGRPPIVGCRGGEICGVDGRVDGALVHDAVEFLGEGEPPVCVPA